MNLEGARIVVIGGAGFIGSHIVDLLLAEPVREVVIFDNLVRAGNGNVAVALKDPRVSLVEGDITKAEALEACLKGADHVFHLAALWLLHCQEMPREAFQVNVAGTFNVLDACVKAGVKRLVYSSSASVYGDAVETPMTEDHPYNNKTFYGATKIAGEHFCRAYHHRYGLDYVGLRYMNVYGPRQDCRGAYTSVLVKMLDRIDAGQSPVAYGDGSQTYDFIHVGDVARANLSALRSGKPDSFYNVGTGKGVTIRELAEMLLELTGSRLPIRYEPQGQTFVTRRIGSVEKAERELGFKPARDLREGLREFVQWRREDRRVEAKA